MRNKIIDIFALVLCIGAFLMPVNAYAASDTTPPTITAWISGEILRIEASDAESGVEAVYINGTRFNYRVDGILDVSARDYAGTGKQISVYAVDFAGNKSDTVLITNPYYTAPTATPTPAATQKPASAATAQPTATPQPTAAATPEPEVTSETTANVTYEPVSDTSESAVPTETTGTTSSETSGGQAFTPNGTGTVVDDIDEKNGKEFFSITTAAGNVFYLIIDRYGSSENVYLLNAVTEDDLMALAEKSSSTVKSSSESAVPTAQPSETQPPTPAETETPAVETAKDSGGNNSTMIFIIIAVLAVGGAGYYFKVMKPKQDAANGGEDEPEDEAGDGEYDYEDDEESGDSAGDSGDDEDYEMETEDE